MPSIEEVAGGEFYSSLVGIVGARNAEQYARLFRPLDDLFFGAILNYEGLAFYTYTTSLNWHEKINP